MPPLLIEQITGQLNACIWSLGLTALRWAGALGWEAGQVDHFGRLKSRWNVIKAMHYQLWSGDIFVDINQRQDVWYGSGLMAQMQRKPWAFNLVQSICLTYLPHTHWSLDIGHHFSINFLFAEGTTLLLELMFTISVTLKRIWLREDRWVNMQMIS